MHKESVYTIVFLSLFLISCNSRQNGFVNHQKWMLDYTLNRAKLKSKPVSVSETQYLNLNDTVFSDTLTGRFNDRWIYSFDKEGNILSVKVFFDSSFYFHTFYNINEDGQQYEFYSYSKGDTTKRYIRSKKIAEGKYKRDNYDSDKIRYSEIWKFADNGQKIIMERYSGDTISFTKTEFYERGELKKITLDEKFRKSENIFYYSKNDYLDSQAIYVNKIPGTKYLYVNNEYGDVVYYERSSSGNVEQRSWMKYQYDDKGNWMKMLEKAEEVRNDLIPINTGQKYPDYRLVIREIKY